MTPQAWDCRHLRRYTCRLSLFLNACLYLRRYTCRLSLILNACLYLRRPQIQRWLAKADFVHKRFWTRPWSLGEKSLDRRYCQTRLLWKCAASLLVLPRWHLSVVGRSVLIRDSAYGSISRPICFAPSLLRPFLFISLLLASDL